MAADETNHAAHLQAMPEGIAAVQQSASANHGTHRGHQHTDLEADAAASKGIHEQAQCARMKLVATPQRSRGEPPLPDLEKALCDEEATQLVATQRLEDTWCDEPSPWQPQQWTEDRQPDPLQHALNIDGEPLSENDELENDDLLIAKLEASSTAKKH